MARGKQKEEPQEGAIITPERFVVKLRAFIEKAKDEDTVAVKEIRELLASVALPGGGLSIVNIMEAVVERLTLHSKTHDAHGLPTANVWRDISKKYGAITLHSVEVAVEELIASGKIVSLENGAMSVISLAPTEEEENIS